MKNKVSVLFVCMGNICRSPTAEGVFRHVVKQKNMLDVISIDSAGTHAYHIGESPDSRSQAMAKSRDVDLSSQRARKAIQEDFERFDYVIAMDNSNFEDLKHLANEKQQSRLYLFMSFVNGKGGKEVPDPSNSWSNSEVPDPYYGGGNGFERVFDMVQSASEGLLQHIVENDLKKK